jgi:AcrR family transcriptional regulator
MPPGLRERKKDRTRRRVAEVALRRFERDGFEATTVHAICAEAEVAVSTFYAYFPSKEAAAFPDDEQRAAIVADVLASPAEEPLHVTLRRASLALADQDAAAQQTYAGRAALVGREPALAAYASRRQQAHVDRLTGVLARRMGVDPSEDLRPRLIISATFGAVNAAWAAWAVSSRTLRELVEEAHDILDAGLAVAVGRDDRPPPPSRGG